MQSSSSVASFFDYMKLHFKSHADKESVIKHLETMNMSDADLEYCRGAVDRRDRFMMHKIQTPPPSLVNTRSTVKEINAVFNSALESEDGCDNETALELLMKYLQVK
jgi:hypothetical protein